MKRVVRRLTQEQVAAMPPDERAKIRKGARLSLARRGKILAFARQIHRKYVVNWHHKIIANALNKWLKGEIQNLIIEAPPRQGKSELVSCLMPPLALGLDPNDRIISAAYSLRLAKEFARNIQRYMSSKPYRNIFPNTRLATGKRDEFAERSAQKLDMVGHYGYYYSTSVGGSVTGLGGTKVNVDDPVQGAAQALSVVIRDAIWYWYVADLCTRLEGRKQKLITMTRWHEDDLVGRALKLAENNPDADQWTVLKFPAIVLDDTELAEWDPRKKGEALWPGKTSAKEWLAMRANDEAFFYALAQNSPVSFGATLFQRMWFKRWHSLELDLGGIASFDSIAYSIDMNLKGRDRTKETDRDFAAIHVWGKKSYPFEHITYPDPSDPERLVYIAKPPDYVLIDRISGRWSFAEAVQEWVNLHRKHPMADTLVVEAAANGPALVSTLQSAGIDIDIVEIVPVGSKKFRWSMASSPVHAGRVWVPATAPWIAEVLDQFHNCLTAAHDDDVDAMAQIINHWNHGSIDGVGLDDANAMLRGLW